MVGEMGPWSLVSGKLFSRGRFSSFEGWWWYFSPYSDVIETKGESKFSLPTVVKNRKFLAEQHTMTVSSASSIFLKEREREREMICEMQYQNICFAKESMTYRYITSILTMAKCWSQWGSQMISCETRWTILLFDLLQRTRAVGICHQQRVYSFGCCGGRGDG